MNYYIVTGASRGLGEAIVKKLLTEDTCIIYVSRKNNQTLEELVKSRKQVFIHFEECDLSKIGQLASLVKRVFSKIDFNNANKITLINNAGKVEPIKNVGDASEKDIVSNVQLNLVAPMVLTEYFIKETKSFSGPTMVVNITSGAANRPIAGWSTYCSTKAGLNMFTNTIGIEQVAKSEVTAIAFSPGIMDTDMQSTIRTAEKDDFDAVDQFKEYHEKGMLRSPSFVAQIIVQLLSGPVDNGRVYDIKEFI